MHILIRTFSIVSVISAALVATSSDAATVKTVLIDFGKATQLSDPNGAERWNDVQDTAGDAYLTVGDFPGLTNLLYTDGSASGFDFDLASSTAVDSTGVGIGGIDMPGTLPASNLPESATRDVLFVLGPNGSDATTTSGGVATFELQNLSTNAGTFYTLRMFSRIIGGDRQDVAFTVDGVTEVVEHFNNTSVFATFPLVQPNGSGVLSIDFTTAIDPDGGFFDQGHWAAFEITELSNLTPGDIDFDDDVDADDLRIILNNFSTINPTLAEGDLTFDGTVDFLDYIAWRDGFLAAGGSSQALARIITGVPEPSTVVMVLISLVSLQCLRWRCRPSS